MLPGVKLRLAVFSDINLLFDWVNEPIVRKMAFDPTLVSYESHVSWFKEKLATANSIIYIAETLDGSAIGQVRFDNTVDNEFVVDIHLSKLYRGKGYGSLMLKQAVKKFTATHKVNNINAYIKKNNSASYHAFLQAGFLPLENKYIREADCFHLIIRST